MATDITRTNYAANSTLTSTALNADFNQIVTRINDFPADKITDATITKDKLAAGATANETVASKSADYTVLVTDQVISGDASGGSITFTLPTAIGNSGLSLFFNRSDSTIANIITLDGNGTETIGGSLTKILYSQNDYIEIISDGSNWLIKSNGIKTRYQTRFLTADVTANTTDIASLKFSSLVVGRTYIAKLNYWITVASAAGGLGYAYVTHDSAQIARGTVSRDDGFNATGTGTVSTAPFTATTTTLEVGFVETGASTLSGNNTAQETIITLFDVTEAYAETTELD